MRRAALPPRACSDASTCIARLGLLPVAEAEVEAREVEVCPLGERAARLLGRGVDSVAGGGSGGDRVEVAVEGLEGRLEGALLHEQLQLQVVGLIDAARWGVGGG